MRSLEKGLEGLATYIMSQTTVSVPEEWGVKYLNEEHEVNDADIATASARHHRW